MIYLITAKREFGIAERDTVSGFVVRADNEGQARLLCSLRAGDEGGGFWLMTSKSDCECIEPEGHAEVILRDCFEG